MADKTIPELTEVTTITENALFVVDTGIQTFKMQAENVALFMRDAILPPGMTAPFAGSVAPAGWFLCDGSAVSRTTYLALFLAVGTTYGIGNGTTTFNLPDLRGRVIAGKDDMGGSTAGRITNAIAGFIGINLGAVGGDQSTTPAGTIGGNQSIAHTHSLSNHVHNMSHSHQWGFRNANQFFTKNTAQQGSTSISAADSQIISANTFASSVGTEVGLKFTFTGTSHYTSGVIDTQLGSSGATANTSGPSPDVTGGMSTAATVNGSNFTFTGTAGHRVQPTMIMNYIIKT